MNYHTSYKLCVIYFSATLFIGALFVVPSVSFAAEIDAIIKVNHDGVNVYDGDTVYKEDFAHSTAYWTFTFNWPNAVSNTQSRFFIFRGAPGNIEGGVPLEGVNHVYNLQSWIAGTTIIKKPMGYGAYDDTQYCAWCRNYVSLLGNASTTSHTYTVMIAELRTGTMTDQNAVLEWFRSASTTGTAPLNHAFLTFNYIATPRQNIALSYADEDGFMPDTESPGVHPNKGTASATPLVFKAVYTGTAAPDEMNVFVGNGSATTSYPMIVDTATASTTLRDNIFTNGEQYTFAQTFPKGNYLYYFEAQSASTTVRLPAQTDAPPTLTFQTGYSSVAFLPGLGGSRLYRQGLVGEDRLWEPNGLNDIPQLGLSSTTYESNNTDIYARGIVDDTLLRMDDWPGTNTYKSFIDFMDNNVVGEGIIQEWEALPYDWRLNLDDILASGRKTGGNISYLEATSTPYIIQELRRLAETSDTGKVTIVTHSNGGFVAKELLRVLEITNDPLLAQVDKLILVASPQIGTPEAVAALLHGTTKIAKGTAREFSENMPAAYHLLPSRSYFSAVTTPAIEFSDDIANVLELADMAGDTIGDYDTLRNFMTGRNGAWSEPSSDHIDTPNVLKEDLLNYADNVHSNLDNWAPPPHIEVIQIAGAGIKTVSGIEYDDCDIPFCADTLNHLDRTLLKTKRGDGTVVIPSALWMSTSTPKVERYYVDIERNNTIFKRNRDHASILEIGSLQEFVKNIIQGGRTFSDNIIRSDEPVIDDVSFFDFRLHSPVQIHLYDEFGNHTGLVENPDSSGIRLYEKNIPNSYYREFGEVKYIGVDGGTSTTLALQGEALGTFTLEIDETRGDNILATTRFVDIPVTASTTATMTVYGLSTTPEFLLDINGDGITDAILTGGEGDIEVSFEIFAGILDSANIHHGLKRDLIEKIKQAQKELAREKPETAIKKLDDIIKKLEEEIKKNTKQEEKRMEDKKQKVSTEEARVLIEIVEKLKASVVE